MVRAIKFDVRDNNALCLRNFLQMLHWQRKGRLRGSIGPESAMVWLCEGSRKHARDEIGNQGADQ
jgi:hypothetical protein